MSFGDREEPTVELLGAPSGSAHGDVRAYTCPMASWCILKEEEKTVLNASNFE